MTLRDAQRILEGVHGGYIQANDPRVPEAKKLWELHHPKKVSVQPRSTILDDAMFHTGVRPYIEI